MSRSASSESRKRVKLVVVAGLFALLVGAVWLARRSTEGSSASATRAPSLVGDAGGAPAREERSPATAATREPVASGASTQNAAADSSPAVDASFAVLAGRIEFEDGSTAPALRVEFEPFPAEGDRSRYDLFHATRAAEAAGECLPSGEGVTDASGRFRVERLCPGSYSVRLSDYPSLRVTPALLEAPNADVVVVLGGYLIRMRPLALDGTPVPKAILRATFQPLRSTSQDAQQAWGMVSHANGVATLVIREAGTFTVAARVGRRFSPTVELELGGPGRLVDVPLVLSELDPECRLCVRVQSDDGRRIPVADWAVSVLDPVTFSQVARPVSEQADSEGRVGDLPQGTFIARLVFRVFDPPVCYLLDGSPIQSTVTLSPDQDASVGFSVPLGGQLLLSTRGEAADESGDRAPQVGATLVAASGGAPNTLEFRLPNATGVLVNATFPLGEERMTHDALPIGDYYLDVHADGFEPDRQRIQIRPGEVTRATCVLRRAR